MVRSMTGFGRAERTADGLDISVELKSVNHRYFELSSRIPRKITFLEDPLKALIREKISRGKIELFINISGEGEDAAVEVNRPFAESYIAALRELSKLYDLPDDISTSTVARNPDVFTVTRAPCDEQSLANAVTGVVKEALDSFIKMRETEGERLKKDVLDRAKVIYSLVGRVEELSPETKKQYFERLKEKVRELLDGAEVDEQRLITETAIFADKIAVDEETVRLKSHISQLETLFEQNEPVGRKLDFLVQEMNREANTIGSKSQNIEIARIVVDIKSEIEKIREQIQNIE